MIGVLSLGGAALRALPYAVGAVAVFGIGWAAGADSATARHVRDARETVHLFGRLTHHAAIERMTREAGLYAELEAERTRAVELAALAERAFTATDEARAQAQARLQALRSQITATDTRLQDALRRLSENTTEWGSVRVPDCIVGILRDGRDPATVSACFDAQPNGGDADAVRSGSAAGADAGAVPGAAAG